jgi:hypothetical protein
MHEWDEVAESLAKLPQATPVQTLDDARTLVRLYFPDEGETLVDNIAWSLMKATQRKDIP